MRWYVLIAQDEEYEPVHRGLLPLNLFQGDFVVKFSFDPNRCAGSHSQDKVKARVLCQLQLDADNITGVQIARFPKEVGKRRWIMSDLGSQRPANVGFLAKKGNRTEQRHHPRIQPLRISLWLAAWATGLITIWSRFTWCGALTA